MVAATDFVTKFNAGEASQTFRILFLQILKSSELLSGIFHVMM